MGRVDADTLHVAAEHHVMFRLTLRGYVTSQASSASADILACSEDGLRVALLRVRVLDADGALVGNEPVAVARNRAYICLEIMDGDQQPSCYIVPSAVFGKVGAWTRSLLEQYRDAWHLLGLDGSSLRIAS